MWYDIVPINQHYRGIDRLLLASDLYIKPFKDKYSFLLDMYYKYLSEIELQPSKEGLSKLIKFCKEFNRHGIQCEMIAYDTNPYSEIWEHTLNYLGIDVVNKCSQSIISHCADISLLPYFNKNGLLNSENDATNIIQFLNQGDAECRLFYVYEIRTESG